MSFKDSNLSVCKLPTSTVHPLHETKVPKGLTKYDGLLQRGWNGGEQRARERTLTVDTF